MVDFDENDDPRMAWKAQVKEHARLYKNRSVDLLRSKATSKRNSISLKRNSTHSKMHGQGLSVFSIHNFDRINRERRESLKKSSSRRVSFNQILEDNDDEKSLFIRYK